MTDAEPIQALFSPETAAAPFDTYRWLRSECPVARSAGMTATGTVLVSRYEDVQWALRHPEVFSSAAEAVAIGQDQPLIPLQVDPPEHAKYRRLLDPEFSPRRMAELEPEVRALVHRLVDGFVERGTCDFHEEFATPLPSTIFLALMGLPQSDLATFLRWRDDTIRPDVEPGDLEGAQRIRERTGREITEYFRAALAQRRSDPDDRLLGRLVQGTVDGRPLTEAELLGICHLLMLGGLDTVTATLDCMISRLVGHPELRHRIASEPGAAAPVVEELLRLETPVQVIPRVLHQDVELRGVDLRAGDHAVLVLGAADTDDAEFTGPEDVRLDRERNRHLAFGGGPHRCLGSHLARLELVVALEEWHRRIPDYDLAPGTELRFSPGIRQADHLPLVWEVTQ